MFTITEAAHRIRPGIIIRILSLAAMAAVFVLLPNTARADSTATYDVSGTLTTGTFSGTIEFDQSGSTLQLINSSLTMNGETFICSGASSNNCTVYDPFSLSYVTMLGDGSVAMLNWLDSSFDISNPPSSFDFMGGYCYNCGVAGYNYVVSGQAANVTAPEPASFMLLGAGILALALLSRRRLTAPATIV